MDWRYVPFKRYDPYFKTGLNLALLESVSEGSDPVAFLAGWEKNCINIGRSQEIEARVNLEEVEKREEVVIVRRQGGGGTTYLTREGEITWNIVAPEKEFPEDVNQVYSQVCGRIASGLERIGIEAWHEPINDIVTENGKISGATLKRKEGAVYIAGTLLYQVDPEEMFSLINPESDKKKRHQIQDYRNRVTSIQQETDTSFEETRKALKATLLENKKWRRTEFSEKETRRARELADKYSSKEWIHTT